MQHPNRRQLRLHHLLLVHLLHPAADEHLRPNRPGHPGEPVPGLHGGAPLLQQLPVRPVSDHRARPTAGRSLPPLVLHLNFKYRKVKSKEFILI